MVAEWSYRATDGGGMEFQREITVQFEVRDYSGAAPDDVKVIATGGDTYNLVNAQGQVLATFQSTGELETRYAKGEPVIGTMGGVPMVADDRIPNGSVIGFTSGGGRVGGGGGGAYRAPQIWGAPKPVGPVLPDGSATTIAPGAYCTCQACKAARKGGVMDRDQVARVAADIGSSLMDDNSQWMNRFTVDSSSSSRVYVVAQRRSDKVWGCSCPAWINRRHCKHLDDILGRLAKLTEFDVTDPAVLDMLRSARTAYLDLDGTVGSGRFTAKAPTYGRQLDL